MRNLTLPLRLVLLVMSLLLPVALQAQEPVVQAILFYSPSCPHCHDVIENVLPPLKAQYGGQLQLVGIDTTKASGQQLFEEAYTRFAPPNASRGVPVLLVGDVYLIGSGDIPAQFPGIIEQGLRDGGIPWPALPSLREALPDLPSDAGTVAAAAAATAVSSVDDKSLLDDAFAAEAPAAVETASGMALAWIVLGGMLIALMYVGWRWLAGRGQPLNLQQAQQRLKGWLIPALALAGLVVALYLAYIEVTQSTAVCGPVGDCNAVQASPYAAISGIPIAVLGVLNYLGILGLWAIIRRAAPRLVPWAAASLAALALLGTFFSIYLTYLEIFVIEAVCAWCLSSAVITTALLLAIIGALLPARPRRDSALEVMGQK